MFVMIRKNRYLILQMIKKDMKQKYAGSVMGKVWIFAVPVIMLIIYTFVFSEIFQSKWNAEMDNKYDFALILFCGLSVFNMVSEVMSRSVSLIQSNCNYVKKVVFPLEILPLTITVTAFLNSLISFMILLAAKMILTHSVSGTIYQALLLFIPLILVCLGISLFISAISVYFRDMNSIISVLVTIFMYVSPVFFSIEAVPEKFRVFCLFNPLTYIIENFRKVMLYGQNLDVSYYLVSIVSTAVIFVIGKVVFAKAKEGFADVI